MTRPTSTLDLVESVKSSREPAAFGKRLAPGQIIDRTPVAGTFVSRMGHTEQILDDRQPVGRRQCLGP
ncbi:MAG: hypothetical protein WD060_03300 [Pirellulales bacterium]